MATVITHVYNEAFLLPYWLKHHREIFDHGIVLDYGSDDASVEICHELVPDWDIRTSRNPDFNAATCDAEVMEVEREVESWKMALTTTEFLCAPDLPSLLDTVEAAGFNGAMIKPVAMVDTAERVSLDSDVPLVQQCHMGFVDGIYANYKCRAIHRHGDGHYSLGRHGAGHPDYLHHPGGALILWFGFAPWMPELRARKLQIQHRMPPSDNINGFGGQHVIDETQLHDKWQEMVGQSYDLRSVPEFVAVTE